MDKKKRKRTDVGLSSTMMVDVLFILLIFFILVSTIKKDSIKVKAPQVPGKADSSKASQQRQYFIKIDNKQQIYLDGKQMSAETLRRELTTIKGKRDNKKEPVAVLIPDQKLPSGKLFEIFLICQQAGIKFQMQGEVAPQAR